MGYSGSATRDISISDHGSKAKAVSKIPQDGLATRRQDAVLLGDVLLCGFFSTSLGNNPKTRNKTRWTTTGPLAGSRKRASIPIGILWRPRRSIGGAGGGTLQDFLQAIGDRPLPPGLCFFPRAAVELRQRAARCDQPRVHRDRLLEGLCRGGVVSAFELAFSQ